MNPNDKNNKQPQQSSNNTSQQSLQNFSFQMPQQIPKQSQQIPLQSQQIPQQSFANNTFQPLPFQQQQIPQQYQHIQTQQMPQQIPNQSQQIPSQSLANSTFQPFPFQQQQFPQQNQYIQPQMFLNNNYRQSSTVQNQQIPFFSNNILDDIASVLSKHFENRLKEDPVKENTFLYRSKNQSIEFDFEKGLHLQLESPYAYYKLDQASSQKIPLKISLKAQDSAMNIENDLLNRSSIDLICVVDISGSMSGEKLNLVKKTLKYIKSILTEYDRLALITFDDFGETLITLKQVTIANDQMFENIFDALRDRGGTVINSGVQLALDLIKNRKFKNEITSVFLLSDGVDNQGFQAFNAIQKTIKSKNIEENYTISTFGFGKDHDANLMKEIATKQGGNFYFIDDLNSIDECFVDALGILFSVIMKDIELVIKVNNTAPLSDMRVNKTYGDMWKFDEMTKSHRISLKLFTKGMKKDYICEINLPPCKKLLQDEEKHRIIMSVGMIGNNVKNQVVKKDKELFVTLLNPEDKIDGLNQLNVDVLVNHLRVKGAEKIELAKELADKRKFDQAQKELDEIFKELNDCVCKDHPSLVVLKADVEKSKKICQETHYSNESKSYLTSFANNNMNQQSCPMSNVGNINNYYANNCQTAMLNGLRKSKN